MGFCECSTQRINDLGYCWGCAQPVRMVEVLLFGEMPFHVIERLIEQRAAQLEHLPQAAQPNPETN